MRELTPALASAHKLFSQWARDVHAAGFRALGAPMQALNAINYFAIGQRDARTALRAAERALGQWCATHESARAECAPALALVRAELLALDSVAER